MKGNGRFKAVQGSERSKDTEIELVNKKLQHFSNDAFQSYYDLFQVN